MAGSHWPPVVRPTRCCTENWGAAAQATPPSANSSGTSLSIRSLVRRKFGPSLGSMGRMQTMANNRVGEAKTLALELYNEAVHGSTGARAQRLRWRDPNHQGHGGTRRKILEQKGFAACEVASLPEHSDENTRVIPRFGRGTDRRRWRHQGRCAFLGQDRLRADNNFRPYCRWRGSRWRSRAASVTGKIARRRRMKFRWWPGRFLWMRRCIQARAGRNH